MCYWKGSERNIGIVLAEFIAEIKSFVFSEEINSGFDFKDVDKPRKNLKRKIEVNQHINKF